MAAFQAEYGTTYTSQYSVMTSLTSIRNNIREQTHPEEHDFVAVLVSNKPLSESQRKSIVEHSSDLVTRCRKDTRNKTMLDAFLLEFGLSNKEGVALMCLAEALLRVPDKMTVDRLIAEKIVSGDWKSHNGKSDSNFVNAATWGMILTGKLVKLDQDITNQTANWMQNLVSKLSEPIVRAAILQSMRIMGGQYVLGRSIDEGVKRGGKQNSSDTRYSFDMLGEAARTEEDALRYFNSYKNAFDHTGKNNTQDSVINSNGVSVKLSALHPQYHFAHYETVMSELLPRIIELCIKAKKYNLGLSIDAEEAARLDMSLDIFEHLSRHPDLQDWDGLGFVLQAYQKRAPLVANWLIALAKDTNRKFMLRLVKGAYWDAEIKHAQENGLEDFPVFTRKANTDVCYLHCAQILLQAPAEIYPQFATHNANTAIAIIELATAAENSNFEFQRLHGMGELLYIHLEKKYQDEAIPLRVYAPIGKHEDLLPYLVRRLLENGANSSFVNSFLDSKTPVDELIVDVYDQVTAFPKYRHSKIAKPIDIFTAAGEARNNAVGIDLDAKLDTDALLKSMDSFINRDLTLGTIVGGVMQSNSPQEVSNPADLSQPAGFVCKSTDADIQSALELADAAYPEWSKTPATHRAEILNNVAELLEQNMPELIAIIAKEAGRTINDGVSEVREAVDFCRYYALQAIETQSGDNTAIGRGVFFCISPWNFPLAIFTGQIAAALAAGNSVIAKPADQTPLIAARAVQLFHQAGCPEKVLHLLTGSGRRIGGVLIPDLRIYGVVFTGSTDTAQFINKQLAEREGEIVPFIAETGGQNCMIVDSTALPEQVVDDVISSAFHSAGQRCSALRVLYLQDDIADKVMTMLKGAIATLKIDDPMQLSSDVGPVIDLKSRKILQAHTNKMSQIAHTTIVAPVDPVLVKSACFFAPRVFEIDSIQQLEHEVFGPILHVIRFSANQLDYVISEINNTGYGLTLGIHSRIESFADYVFNKTKVGNTYINRNMIGAAVGVNPFGGQGLSGTGPKAGGPNYIYRFQKPADFPSYESTLDSTDTALSEIEPTNKKDLTYADNSLPAFKEWQKVSVTTRCEILNNAIDDKNLYFAKSFKALTQAAISKLSKPIALPGPTGEENFLFSMPRGPVLCVCHDNDSINDILLNICLILACGNSIAVIASNQELKVLNQFRDKLLKAGLAKLTFQLAKASSLAELVVDEIFVVVVSQNRTKQNNAINRLLAQRTGIITPLVEILPSLKNDQHAWFADMTYLTTEKTKTDNLVARGGNTQLFNLME